MFLNARNLCNKIHLFDSYAKNTELDFTTITVTRAHSLLFDGIFNIVGNNLFRKDCINCGGGRVMVYVRSSVSGILYIHLNQSQQEILLYNIRITVRVIYHPSKLPPGHTELTPRKQPLMFLLLVTSITLRLSWKPFVDIKVRWFR